MRSATSHRRFSARPALPLPALLGALLCLPTSGCADPAPVAFVAWPQALHPSPAMPAAPVATAFIPASHARDAAPVDAVARRLLDRHNGERARLGLVPLRWNRRLAEDAARWGYRLAAAGAFDHEEPGTPTAAEPYRDAGENLWAGTARAFSPEEMVDAWIAERRWFRAGRFPDVAAGTDWEAIGHYTQMIWPATREVGCALVPANREDILVCRYYPAGNVEGEYVGEMTQMAENFTPL